jgi:uncharacterized protein (DUF39 family)
MCNPKISIDRINQVALIEARDIWQEYCLPTKLPDRSVTAELSRS